MNNLHLLSSNTRLSYTLYCRPEYPQANKKSKIHYNYLIALKSHVTFLLLLSLYLFNILNSSSKSSHSLFYTFSKINQFTVSMTAIPDKHIRFSPSPKSSSNILLKQDSFLNTKHFLSMSSRVKLI